MANQTIWEEGRGPVGSEKSYSIPIKALVRGSIQVYATSRRAALKQARQLAREASVDLTLSGFAAKKTSVRVTKK